MTGAAGSLRIGGVAGAHGEAVWWPAGAELTIAAPAQGMRSYLAVAGGIDVAPVLGSRSTDTLAWVGPPRVGDGDRLPVGTATSTPRPLDVAPRARRGPLRVTPGPRDDWFDPTAWQTLSCSSYVVTTESNRIGLRLDGPELRGRAPTSCPARGWCSARCRCRRTAGPWCSWPITHRPVATR